MKLLFHSNAPWVPTGYGVQTALFAPRLDAHHDIAISAFYGLEGKAINWRGIPVLPGAGGTVGMESLPGHANAYFGEPRGGLVITLMDVWVMDPQVIGKLNVASWVPVDHDPVQRSIRLYFENSSAIPVAMSKFGQEQLGDYDPLYVPHAVDTSVYKPTESTMRERMGIDEDAFLIGVVAANKGYPSRKCFSELLQAFKAFQKRHEDAFLYLHTVCDPSWSDGEDIARMLQGMAIPEGAVIYPDQYRMKLAPFPDETMAEVYSSFDVLLNPAAGEGFGVPIVEAQACGVPVIVTDVTAMNEVAGAGWKVPGYPRWTPACSWQFSPDIGEIVNALEACHSMPGGKRDALSIQARQHAEQYDVERVMTEHMLPALAEVQERIGAPVEAEPAAA